MFKNYLVAIFALVMLVSVLTPSAILLADVKIELFTMNDFPEEDANSNEIDISENEIISFLYQKYDLVNLETRASLVGFHQNYRLSYTSDIYLPPPEQLL